MVRASLIYCQPPPQQAPHSVVELPLLPGSDPLILGVYQWTVAHSLSLQEVVRQLAAADLKARYRLIPGLSGRYGSTIYATSDGYQIDVEVPILAWSQCGDALEPWVASSLFLALEVVSKERYRVNSNPHIYSFIQGSIHASFIFQNRVRKELLITDSVRLKDLPDGASIYESGFRPTSTTQGKPSRRSLPNGLK